MTKIVYVELEELSKAQIRVMNFIDFWVRSEKTPIPKQEIVAKMRTENTGEATTTAALRALLKKGYLRKAMIISNKVYYVQLRRI